MNVKVRILNFTKRSVSDHSGQSHTRGRCTLQSNTKLQKSCKTYNIYINTNFVDLSKKNKKFQSFKHILII